MLNSNACHHGRPIAQLITKIASATISIMSKTFFDRILPYPPFALWVALLPRLLLFINPHASIRLFAQAM